MGAGQGGRVLIIVFNGAQNIKPTNSLRSLSSRGAVTEDDGGWAQETSDGWRLGPVDKQSIFWCRGNVRVNKIKSGARTLTSNNAKGADVKATSPGSPGMSRTFTEAHYF